MVVKGILVADGKDHIRYTVSYINHMQLRRVASVLGAEFSSFANGPYWANQWTKFAPRLQQLSHIVQDCACRGSQIETESAAEPFHNAVMQGPPPPR